MPVDCGQCEQTFSQTAHDNKQTLTHVYLPCFKRHDAEPQRHLYAGDWDMDG